VVIGDPYGTLVGAPRGAFGGALDFEAAPDVRRRLPRRDGDGARSCEAGWDLADAGFGIAGLHGLPPNTRIILSDGSRDLTVRAIRVGIS